MSEFQLTMTVCGGGVCLVFLFNFCLRMLSTLEEAEPIFMSLVMKLCMET